MFNNEQCQKLNIKAEDSQLLEGLSFEQKCQIISAFRNLPEEDIRLIGLFMQKKLINVDERKTIDEKRRKEDKNIFDALCEILTKSNDDERAKKMIKVTYENYSTEVSKLFRDQQTHTKLEVKSMNAGDSTNTNADPSASITKEPVPYDWYYADYSELSGEQITQVDAVRLAAGSFGGSWTSVFLKLGFKLNNIELELQEVGNSPVRAIQNLLIKWIHRNGRHATVQRLIDVLIDCSEDATIDWESVENVLRKKKEGMKKSSQPH